MNLYSEKVKRYGLVNENSYLSDSIWDRKNLGNPLEVISQFEIFQRKWRWSQIYLRRTGTWVRIDLNISHSWLNDGSPKIKFSL